MGTRSMNIFILMNLLTTGNSFEKFEFLGQELSLIKIFNGPLLGRKIIAVKIHFLLELIYL